jgi:hypothetical protein
VVDSGVGTIEFFIDGTSAGGSYMVTREPR